MSYPLDPAMEMSEAEYMGYLQVDDELLDLPVPTCHACEDGGSRHADHCEFADHEPSAAAIANAQPEWVPEVGTSGDRILSMMCSIYGAPVMSAGFSLLLRLRGTIWRTKDGQEMTVDQMTDSHATNLLAWLDKRANVIHLAAKTEAAFYVMNHSGGEHAHDALEQAEDELREMDALDYLCELPMYRTLKGRVS